MTAIQEHLFSLQDLKYRDFNSKLIPTVAPDLIIGVRTPELRKYAKAIYGSAEAEEFLRALPHRYFEENNLHAFLLENRKDYHQLIEELNLFLPCVDNWGTCDTLSPAIFKKHLPKLREQCRVWLDSKHTYVVRFAIGMLMRHFLDDAFSSEYLCWVASVRSEEYYIQMMTAWYFATALAKQYDAALPYLSDHKLDDWTHSKAIQKAIESNRITPEQKAFLRTLKVK